jgi:hypothetical protein
MSIDDAKDNEGMGEMLRKIPVEIIAPAEQNDQNANTPAMRTRNITVR